MRGMPRLRRTVLFGVVALSFGACGLESYPYLYAPEVDEYPLAESGTIFRFANDSRNDPEYFEGYELYYRLYRATDGETDGATKANSDASSLADGALLAEYQSLGYARLYVFDPNQSNTPILQRPLIPLNAADRVDTGLEIRLDFTSVQDELPVASYQNIEFGRYVVAANNQTTFRGFAADEFLAGDSDLPEDFDPQAPEETVLYIALAALSYGNDIISLNFNLLSSPTYLGVLRLSIVS